MLNYLKYYNIFNIPQLMGRLVLPWIEDLLEEVAAHRLTPEAASAEIRSRSKQRLTSIPPPARRYLPVLHQLAAGTIPTEEAATQIRRLAIQPYFPPWGFRIFKVAWSFLAVVGLSILIWNASFSIGTRETDGTVIRMNGGKPVIEYSVAGQQHTIEGILSSKPPRYSVGDKAKVLYFPDRPHIAQLNSPAERFLFPLAFIAAGTGAFAVSHFLQRSGFCSS